MKKLLSILFVLLTCVHMRATHIIGGEMIYDDLGGGNYKVTLKVYRDCYNGIPPFDNPASLFIFDASGSLVQTVELYNPQITPVPGQINSPCITPPTDVCVEQAIYQTNITLPPKTGGYNLVYQRCCRNNSILNLVSPGGTGSTFMEHIPGPEQVSNNNSPRFNNFPPIYICNGFPIDFDHSANDPDGDSLVYSLCPPLNGLDACCPILGAVSGPGAPGPNCPSPPSSCPQNASPPPYPTVNFLSPYNGSYPLSSNPAINIHPHNGFLTGEPNINGQWVVGVCVSEYRNGVLIGTHRRDFQFNVRTCQGLTVASIPQQNSPCEGYTIQFNNNSAGANTYFWDFGVPGITTDISSAMSPSYTYPDTGHYTVTMIASFNGAAACSDTAIIVVTIYPTVAPSFIPPAAQCITNNSFSFTAGGSFMGNGTFNWNFGNNANPSISPIRDPVGVNFLTPGYHPVTLTISENGCTHSYTDSVQVYVVPEADFRSDSLIGCKPFTVQFSDNSNVSTSPTYIWNFGDGTTSTLANPIHTYADTGTYNVSLTITTNSGCVGSSTYSIPGMIQVKPSPTAGIDADPKITSVFNPIFNLTDNSFNVDSMIVNTGDGFVYNTVPAVHYYEEYGEYTIQQVVINEWGCTDTASVKVTILPEYLFYIPNAFTPFNNDGLNTVFKPLMMGVKDYTFMIFNRWGELLFETHDVNEGWDGMYKGKRCQIDVYVYRIEYNDVLYDVPHQHKGTVTLMR